MSARYESPLCKRYAGRDMQFIFSDDLKFSTWRRLWLALAEAQKELGLDITDEQINEMKAHITDIDYEQAAAFEAQTRHDVMAHIKTYGMVCPKAKPIIHLGATSCYVGDNTDLIIQREALIIIKKLLVNAIRVLCAFADKHKDLPTLAYTHFQAAQPTTVGKRAAMWAQDFLFDLEHLEFVLNNLKFLGCRGTTGTAAGFLSLFDGDHEKVKSLERIIAAKMGFTEVYAVSGQTYSRKIDYYIVSVLSGIAQSAYKFSNDIRLMSHLKEVDEPFEPGQVGSSAMAYKRNPMRSERIASLSRHIISNTANQAATASAQWLERTLDDSANKRIAVPEAFLAADGVLSLVINIMEGIVVYPNVIAAHLNEELPFMATENILMYLVKRGGDRQALHERLRVHCVAAAKKIKTEGGANDLLRRILTDSQIGITENEISALLNPKDFTGRASEQTEEFLERAREILLAYDEVPNVGVDVIV